MAYVAVTNTFSNGTTSDASQVNTNFTDIINGLSDGTKDLNMNAATFAGAVTMNGNVTLGNASSDVITPTGTFTGNLIPTTTGTYALGSTSLKWNSLYLNLTTGSVLFVGSNGLITQDNTNLFWDDTNNRLGIGIATPQKVLHVKTATDKCFIVDTTSALTGSVSLNAVNDANTVNIPMELRGSEFGFTGPTTSTYISTAGNVGIGGQVDGTQLPKLYIKGGFSAGTSTTSYGGLYIASSDSVAADKGGVISFGGVYTGSTDTRWAAICGLKDNSTSGEYGGYLDFYTRANGAAPVRYLRIGSSGIMTLGTTALTAGMFNMYTAANTANIMYMYKNTQAEMVMGFASSTDTNFYMGVGSSSINTYGPWLTNTGTGWTNRSDEKLKDIDGPIDNALLKLKSLRTVMGNFKNDPAKKKKPFILAQDVEKVFPDACSTAGVGPDAVLGVCYTDLIPVLIAAVKELEDKVNAIKVK